MLVFDGEVICMGSLPMDLGEVLFGDRTAILRDLARWSSEGPKGLRC